MFDGLKDMGKLMKQAKDMKSKLKKVQKELKSLEIEHNHNGKIKVLVNGEMDILDIKFNPAYWEDIEKKRLEKDIKEACNKAITEAKAKASSQLSEVTGGLNLPGM